MFDSSYYKENIKGEIRKVNFESLIPSKTNPEPDFRIKSFIVTSAFVLVTEGAFETEYFYKRNLVLDEDYLSDEGGEAALVPYIGLEHRNNYLGDKTVIWHEGRNKWDALRFDRFEDTSCDEDLYLTEQRNCAYYAAVYVECAKSYDAVIAYETSGSLLYVNGELIDNKPYGRVKGLRDFGNLVAVHFNKGLNLVMFKVRSGYICDTMDVTVSNFAIYPYAASADKLGVCFPTKTAAYFGTAKEPRQVLPTFVHANNGGELHYECDDYSETLKLEASSDVKVVNLSVPAKSGGTKRVKLKVTDSNGKSDTAAFELTVKKFDGFVGTEHVYSDFHFDTTYHQEQRTYAFGAFDILSKMLKKLNSNPDFKAILSEVDYLHPYYSLYPNDRETMKKAFSEGRAEPDCFYNQPNEMTSSSEGLVRNLVYGQLYHRDVLGRKAYVYGPGDVFGHPNQLSQICKKGGCDGVFWGKHIFGLDCLYHAMSPDGSTLIHSRGGTSRESALSLGVTHCNDSSKVSNFAPYPRDDDTKWMSQTVNGAEFSVMSDFMHGIIEDDNQAVFEQGEPILETASRDISLYHAGVSLTRQDLKTANRLGENLLITAEKLATIASYFGADYPDLALDKAWRQLLCGQHHDSITGTNNEISFVDLMIEYREAACAASKIIDNSMSFLISGIILNSKSFPVFVFNPLGFNRKDSCSVFLPLKSKENYTLVDSDKKEYRLQLTGKKDSKGNSEAVFTPVTPALGWSVYYLEKTDKADETAVSADISAENDCFRLTVDPSRGGGIVSVYDKKNKRELVQKGKCSFVAALKEIRNRMETQHEFYTTGEKLLSCDYPATVISEKGVNYERITVRSRMGMLCELKQQFTLTHGVRRIDIKITVEDYQSDDHLFTFDMPVSVADGKAIFDDRFSPAVRPKSRFTLDFKTHQFAMFSHCSVFAANQWFCLGPTVRMSFAGKGSVNIGSTALISTENAGIKKSADILLKALTKKAIPVTPYPDKQRKCRATHLIHFNEDLHFTDTRFVLSVNGVPNEYEEKLFADNHKIREKFNLSLEKNGVAVLYAEDCDNIWKKQIDVVLIKAIDDKSLRAYIAELVGNIATGDKIDFRYAVCAAKPVVADDYTAAILNKGNLASSVEGDNSLNIMLFHTATFYGNSGKVTGGNELVPEQKTHVFDFALTAGAGSYRDCGLYREALAFNDGLLVKTGKPSKGKKLLPEKFSFADFGGSFVLTSLKAGGYPLASLKGGHSDFYQRGIAVRGFECDGNESEIKSNYCFNLGTVYSTDLLEEGLSPVKHGIHSVKETVGAHSIETRLIFPKATEKPIGNAIIGDTAEPIQPVYIRSWEHSRGSMPMSYLGICAVIDKKTEIISETELEVTVSVVNNYTDIPASGVLKLKTPAGISADKKTFKYDLAPGEFKLYKVRINKASPESKGILVLEYSDGDNNFYDTFIIGFFNPSLSVKIKDNAIHCTVMNNTTQPLFGELAVATPVESWGLDFSSAVCDISPLSVLVDIPAGSSRDYSFSVNVLDDSVINAYWACAKLMVNGKVYYAYDRQKGARRNIWAHEFVGEIEADGGSMKKYLEFIE